MKLTILFMAAVSCSVFLFSCLNQNSKDERLAKQYCASCHTFPDPDCWIKRPGKIVFFRRWHFVWELTILNCQRLVRRINLM